MDIGTCSDMLCTILLYVYYAGIFVDSDHKVSRHLSPEFEPGYATPKLSVRTPKKSRSERLSCWLHDIFTDAQTTASDVS